MPLLPRFSLTEPLHRGVVLTLACLWLTLPARAEAQPRLLPETALSAPMLADASLTTAAPLETATRASIDGGRTESQRWVRAKLVRQWGMMMLVEALAFTGLLAAEAASNDGGYPLREDSYGCGGRAAPIATAAVGTVGLALTIKGTFGMRRHHEGRPVRFGDGRERIRRLSPLLAMGALAVAGTLVGTAFHDLFCNS